MSRYTCTPLPQIGTSIDQENYDTEAADVGSIEAETENKDQSGFNDVPDVDLSNVAMEDVFRELNHVVSRMVKKIKLKDAAYLIAASVKYGNFDEGDKLGRHLLSLNFVEIFQKNCRENFVKIMKAKGNLKAWNNLYLILWVLGNMSDKCSIVCERILKIEVHSDILGFLQSKHLSPSLMKEDRPSSMAEAFISILHNVVQRAAGAREALRARSAVEILQPFRVCNNRMVSFLSLMVQAYLVTETENEKINSGDEAFQFLVNLLDAAIRNTYHENLKCTVIETLEVLNKLAANDKNKQRIVNNGALPYYVDLMSSKWTPREQAEAAHGIWILAFKCKKEILNQPGCIEALKALQESSDEKVKKEAEGALWILEEKTGEKSRQTPDLADGHIFISYQWDSKATVLKIRDLLKAAGFRVWIDEDDMSGSVLEAMATAVEKAVVVVICLSEKYKESPNCRTEAGYAFRRKKKVVPIRLQTKYYPDGWLGVLVESLLVFDFSDASMAEENIKRLIKELGHAGKGQDETDCVRPVHVTVNDALNNPSHEKTSPVKYWTKDDVSKWIVDNNLGHVKKCFSGFTGSLLLEYKAMRLEAPEAFFAYLREKSVSLSEALAISQALRSL